MKKVFLLVLAAVMVFGCVSSYAAAPRESGNDRDLYGDVTFSKAGARIGQSFLSNDIGSGENEIREDWTNSRGLDNNGALFVNLGTEDAPNVAVEVTGSAYASADFNANDGGSTADVQLVAYVDLKYVKDAAFCGIVMDSTENGSWGSGATTTPIRADGKYILNTGYGFTLRAGNILEAYISVSASGTIDAAQFDLSKFGIDASEFNSYAIYRTTEKKAYIAVDNILVSVMDLAAGAIYEADGETVGAVASGDPSWANDDRYNTDGKPFFCITGDGDTDVFFDNIGYKEFSALPAFAKYKTVDAPLCNGVGGVGTNWIQGAAGSYDAVALDVLSDFYGFKIPIIWTSNPVNNQNAIDLKTEVFAFDTDLDTSFTGTPKYTVTRTYSHDDSNGDEFIFDSALPAGKYVIKFTTLTADGADGKGAYFVLPTNDDLVYDGFHYIFKGTPFNLILKLKDNKDYLGIIGDSETVAATGASDTKGENAHQLTGHGPLAVAINIPEGYTLKALNGHSPTWGDSTSGIVATFYKWTGSYDDSVAGTVLATATLENYSEAAQWCTLPLDNELPAGEYLVLFEAGNEHHVGFWNATSRGNDILGVFRGTGMAETVSYTPVLKFVRGLAKDEPVTDEPTTDEPTTDEPTTDEPTTDEPTTDEPTTDEPATDAPQTGDMTVTVLAVIAVVALAAIIVLKKRVNA